MPIVYICDICGAKIEGDLLENIWKIKLVIGKGPLHDFDTHDDCGGTIFEVVCVKCKDNSLSPKKPPVYRTINTVE